jgi:2-methylisocitrate lyase-like PEP mutase family enzyme
VDSQLARKAEEVQRLHREDGLLVVPNAFDAASARMLEKVGFSTIATSSAAVAWTAGYPDGQVMPFEEMMGAVACIARAVDIPVSADLEAGYVGASGGIERTIAALIETGAVGLNLEDSNHDGDGSLVEPEAHAELIAAARESADEHGIPLFINARTDVFWKGVGEAGGRVNETARRLLLCEDVGADCVFVPGIAEADEIESLVGRLHVPLNVMHMPATPDLRELERLGVRRVSFGADLLLGALAQVESAAHAIRRGDLRPLEALGQPSQDIAQVVMGL